MSNVYQVATTRSGTKTHLVWEYTSKLLGDGIASGCGVALNKNVSRLTSLKNEGDVTCKGCLAWMESNHISIVKDAIHVVPCPGNPHLVMIIRDNDTEAKEK